MPDDFSKFELMKGAGASPEHAYREAMKDGLDAIARIRMVRRVYSLTLGEAKEVFVKVENGAESLDQFQEQLAKEAEKYIEQHKAPA